MPLTLEYSFVHEIQLHQIDSETITTAFKPQNFLSRYPLDRGFRGKFIEPSFTIANSKAELLNILEQIFSQNERCCLFLMCLISILFIRTWSEHSNTIVELINYETTCIDLLEFLTVLIFCFKNCCELELICDLFLKLISLNVPDRWTMYLLLTRTPENQ